jgi:thiol:disulfide interchange protein DsbC
MFQQGVVMKKWLVGLVVLSFGYGLAMADDKTDRIRAALHKAVPDMKPDKIVPAAIAGIYEVKYGNEIYYVSDDGRFLIRGEVIDLERKKNLTEDSRSAVRRVLIDSIDQSNMIIFSPKKVKHDITVFTDVDCGYCRKMHQEIGELNNYGIEVRYLLFPRAGLNSQSYVKAQSVWCSSDRNTALTDAKLGKTLPEKKCANPIAKNVELADRIGLSGTPTLVLDNGEIISGYVAAEKLKEILDSTKGS